MPLRRSEQDRIRFVNCLGAVDRGISCQYSILACYGTHKSEELDYTF